VPLRWRRGVDGTIRRHQKRANARRRQCRADALQQGGVLGVVGERDHCLMLADACHTESREDGASQEVLLLLRRELLTRL
jgi:hypothetical protein